MEIIASVLNYFIIAEIAQVALLVFILLFMKKNHQANVFLSIYIAILSIPFIAFFIREAGFIYASHFAMSISVAATSVSGVFIFLYIKLISGQIRHIGKHHLIHFIPFPVFFPLVFAFLPPDMPGTETGLLHIMIPFILIISIIIPTIYISVSFLMIRRYYLAAEEWYSDADQFNMSWLKKITVISLILFFWWDLNFIIDTLYTVNIKFIFPIPHLILVFSILLLSAYHVLRQEEIFTDSEEINQLYEESHAENPSSTSHKYAKQSIDEAIQKQYMEKLLNFMNTQKPYLDEGITIRKLSEALSIPIHHLSIVINSNLNKNFSSFINEYRIRDAKMMLHENKDDDINILSIAFQSGFCSKSSFNTTFKKITGKTPSEYRFSA